MVLFLTVRVIHELDLKVQLTGEELKTKTITIERQNHELEDRADQQRKQEKKIQVIRGEYVCHSHNTEMASTCNC